jgi:hypothetical protein
LNENSCDKENEKYYMDSVKSLESKLLKEKTSIDKKLRAIEKSKPKITTNNMNIEGDLNIIGRDLVNNNNNVKMVVITKEYIMQNFTDEPCLKPLDNYDDMRSENLIMEPKHKDENVMFINTILVQYESNKLVEYISDMIVSFYKKDGNEHEQAFWCSDVPRLKFLVRVLPMHADTNVWATDPSGILIKKQVIKPLLRYMIKCIDSYRIKYNKITGPDIDKHLKLSDIVKSISNNTLSTHIARKIAPHFNLGKHIAIKNE